MQKERNKMGGNESQTKNGRKKEEETEREREEVK